MKNVFLIIVCFFLININAANADVKLPKLVSNGMVLQRDKPIKIWGWASPSEKISVSFSTKTYKTTATADGKWQVVLPAQRAGGPYNMVITGNNKIELTDILVGDVWFCSGQSNMQFVMLDAQEKYAAEIANCVNPLIRQFSIPDRLANETTIHDELIGGSWAELDSKSVLKFSAVAYFFARELFNREHIPIGIINASWGGTPIESWIDEKKYINFPAILEQVNHLKDTGYVAQMLRNNAAASKAAAERTDRKWDEGSNSNPKWPDTVYDAAGWKDIMVPGYWNDQGIRDLNGVVWYRKVIDVPQSIVGKPGIVHLGRIFETDEFYINGRLLGRGYSLYQNRRYALPPDALKPGRNIVVVRVSCAWGKGGFVPDKPYDIVVGQEKIDLSGKWQYKVGQAFKPMAQPYVSYIPFYQPTVLYNMMVAPVANFKIKGMVWYQGESNTARAKEHQKLLPTLINDWRENWNDPQLPFLCVQLPNYGDADYLPVESQWAELREAEAMSLGMKATGMAVTMDLGEWNDIHPLDKKDVGMRLALVAEKIAYGNNKIVFSGPTFRSAAIDGDKIIISFTNTGGGLVAKGETQLRYFAIAGADKKFVWARAVIDGDKVIVSSVDIKQPRYVRYAWADNPDGANLYNKEGLPAAPFRTDN